MSYSHHSDGTPRRLPGQPIAVCDGCAKIRDGDEADSRCECGETGVQFVSYRDFEAEAKGWT